MWPYVSIHLLCNNKILMDYTKYPYTSQELRTIYNKLAYPRIIEEKMLILLRQGKVGKWFSGIGQEAVSVGITHALHPDEYILPLHRNLGVFTGRNIPFAKLFAQWQGKASGFTKGRDRSFHFGTNEHHIVGMISHLGAMLGVANGISTAHLLNKNKKISAVFSGDGGASEGDFHEALNVAAVWKLPVLFVLENNGYGLSTPSNEQFACKQFIDKGIGYGMEAVQVDGNNILEVYDTVKNLAESMRENPRPVLLECMTFRMRGHEEASGTKYVPKELTEHWAVKDPIANYESYLKEKGIIDEEYIADFKAETIKNIDADLEKVFLEPEIDADLDTELTDMYAKHVHVAVNADGPTEEMRLVDAVSQGLELCMEKFPDLIIMGQDVAEYGGVFKITDGFLDKFGKDRVRNTPITESSILGAGYGLAIAGKKAVVEMQFADFVSCGINQIANNLAKSHYRWGQAADVVVRMPSGAGAQAGPFHSQSNEAWFYKTPGLKIYYPSNAYDAKGLLASAIENPNPVMFFEHKHLYRSVKGEVPVAYYNIPEGQAAVHNHGSDAVIITYGWGVHVALEIVSKLNAKVTVVDLRTLVPWDKETVYNEVKRCNKVLMLTEDTITGSIIHDLASAISHDCFSSLDAPVKTLGSIDTAVPMVKNLEDQFLPWKRLESTLQELLNY